MTQVQIQSVKYRRPDPPAARIPCKLSREEVAIKYAPRVDPSWTPERAAAFFQTLPKCTATMGVKPDSLWLVKEYAKETLGAARVSTGYANALGSVLRAFAVADEAGVEVRVAQRMEQHGTPQSIRTIQAQMHKAGVLDRVMREQGDGFVGPVYVYAPALPLRFRKATVADLEAAYRACERGHVAYPDLPTNLIDSSDVPY